MTSDPPEIFQIAIHRASRRVILIHHQHGPPLFPTHPETISTHPYPTTPPVTNHRSLSITVPNTYLILSDSLFPSVYHTLYQLQALVGNRTLNSGPARRPRIPSSSQSHLAPPSAYLSKSTRRPDPPAGEILPSARSSALLRGACRLLGHVLMRSTGGVDGSVCGRIWGFFDGLCTVFVGRPIENRMEEFGCVVSRETLHT